MLFLTVRLWSVHVSMPCIILCAVGLLDNAQRKGRVLMNTVRNTNLVVRPGVVSLHFCMLVVMSWFSLKLNHTPKNNIVDRPLVGLFLISNWQENDEMTKHFSHVRCSQPYCDG